MKTLVLLAIALVLTTSAGLALDRTTPQGVSTSASVRAAALDGQAKEAPNGLFVLDNDTWETYLHWHQEARGILPAVCNGDCAARPTPARISLIHPY
ncbi:MAG: hypothetical protein F9K47_09880 [Burkholderiales bacterium]|nr:MAG: hypothetical protein F9K47_09880 [Burkholderiales bacterium]